MKCFLAVNQLNNPVFLDFDAEFTQFIRKKAVEVGLQDLSQTPDDADSAEVDTAVVTQLFSPLVLSQVPLDDQVQNPCTSISCPNGFLLVFKKLDDIQYITICGDGGETEDFLQKKIQMFIRLTKFLFGPVYTDIANCLASERASRWTFLRGILHTWSHMAATDQTFLVEALERLHVNQLVSEKCVGLLEKTVNKMQSASVDQPTQHAFLLVNTKLLALFSKRSSFELQVADILMTTLLAQDMFPFSDTISELLAPSTTYPIHKNHSITHSSEPSQPNTDNDRDEKSDEEFHSAPTTPSQRSPTPVTDTDLASNLVLGQTDDSPGEEKSGLQAKSRGVQSNGNIATGGREGDDGGLERLMTVAESRKSSSYQDSLSSGHRGSVPTSSSTVSVESDYPLLSPHNSGAENITQASFTLSARQLLMDLGQRDHGSPADGKISGRISTPRTSLAAESGNLSQGHSRSTMEQSMRPDHSVSTADYWPHSVFLQTRSCHYAPHSLHCAQILPGITLVVVSQMIGYSVADPLCQVLGIVQDLLAGRRNKLSRLQGMHVYTVISELLRKVHTLVKKVKRQGIQNSSVDILQRWENVDMREKLISYLEQDENKHMKPGLESPLMDIQRRMKDLFHQLFVVPGRLGGGVEEIGKDWRDVFSRMRVRLQQELMDYRDYLSIKAQRNITMTSYLDDFPGLVHFIYVDRQYQQMTAPSFNIMSDHGRQDATLFLKEKVWTMYGYMMKKLEQGYTSVLLRDGDFYYSFFLWFEDSMGNPVPVQEPYKPDVETALPGTLTGSFYRRLQRQCFPHKVEGAVHCYEMFLVHVGLVTPQYIAAHCQKLAHKLWEMSGEAFTSVNLL